MDEPLTAMCVFWLFLDTIHKPVFIKEKKIVKIVKDKICLFPKIHILES